MEPSSDSNINRVILDRYQIREQLGRGSFGTVYVADDLRALRRVVVKLSDFAGDETTRQAFFRETEVLAKVNDPHIVSLYDYGMTDEGYGYIVRQYVAGKTVSELLHEQGALEVGYSVGVAISVLEGLRQLHRADIIHRDIKPNNIIVPRGPDSAMLLDFGIVGKLQSSGETMVGEFFGTPYYMSPEQLEAKPQSSKSDIYSLGATLYEMIYGTPAFTGQSLSSVVYAKFAGQVKFPTDRNLPESLVSFIRRSLSVKPEARPQSAESAIEELQKILNAYESVPHPQPPPAPVVDTVSDERGQPWLAALVAIAAVVLAILGTWIWFRWGTRYQVLGIVIGVLYALSGIAVAMLLRELIRNRRDEVEIRSGNLLLASRSRIDLSASLALDVNNLIAKVRKIDDRILAASLAIMVSEFQSASEGQMRQAAIMNVVQLLEKLTKNLSPWYVKYEKLLAFSVSAVGIVSGLTTVATTILKMMRGQ